MAIKRVTTRYEKKLTNYFENLSLVMVVLMSLLPFFALFAPPKHGEIFIFLSWFEIGAMVIALVTYLYNYYLVFSKKSEKTKTEHLLGQIKDYFSKNKHAFLLLIVYLCVVVSVFFAKDTNRALMGNTFRPDGLLMHTTFLALFVFSSFIKKEEHKKVIYTVFIISFIAQGWIMFQQYYGAIGSDQKESLGKFGDFLTIQNIKANIFTGHFFKGNTGSFYNLNHLGYYIAMACMLSAGLFMTSKKTSGKIWSAVFLCFATWILILNDTFGAYLAVLFALIIIAIVMLFRVKSKITTAILPLVLFIAVSVGTTYISQRQSTIAYNFSTLGRDISSITTHLFGSGDSDADADKGADSASPGTPSVNPDDAGSSRWVVWTNTIEMISEKPIVGYGPDNLKEEYTQRKVAVDRAHNEPLERAVSTGILSAVCYVGAVLYVIWQGLKRKDHLSETSVLIPLCVVLGYSISALVGVFLFYTACHYMIFMGLMTKR